MTTCDGVNVSLSGQNLFPMYLDQSKAWVAVPVSRKLVKKQAGSILWCRDPNFMESLWVFGVLLLMLVGNLVTELDGERFLRQTADIWVMGNGYFWGLIYNKWKRDCAVSFLLCIQKLLWVLRGKILLSVWSFSVKVNIEVEALDTFYALVKAKGIEEKCILKIIESGKGIILLPKDIVHLICKYITKKQISIVKIPISIHNALRNRLL